MEPDAESRDPRRLRLMGEIVKALKREIDDKGVRTRFHGWADGFLMVERHRETRGNCRKL